MVGCTVCVLLILVAPKVAAQQITKPSEVTCRVSTTWDGHQYSRTKITVRPQSDRNVTHEFGGTGYADTAIFCDLGDKPVSLYQFVSTKNEIICKCMAKYCDPDNAVIEQWLNETRCEAMRCQPRGWQKVLSVIEWNGVNQFQIKAFRTQFSSFSYRCVLQTDFRIAANSNAEMSLDRIVLTVSFVILLVLRKATFSS